MSDDKMYCPRGSGPDSPFMAPFNGEMHWREDGTCSYCGSISPEHLFQCLEANPPCQIVPTDKNYKIYVRGMHHQKFYFQHFSDDDMRKFIDLLNEKKINFGAPGYFYVLPFFIKQG